MPTFLARGLPGGLPAAALGLPTKLLALGSTASWPSLPAASPHAHELRKGWWLHQGIKASRLAELAWIVLRSVTIWVQLPGMVQRLMVVWDLVVETAMLAAAAGMQHGPSGE